MKYFILYLLTLFLLSKVEQLSIKKAANLQEIFEQIDQKIKDTNELQKQMKSNNETITNLQNQTFILDSENKRLQKFNSTKSNSTKEEEEDNKKIEEQMELLAQVELEETRKQFDKEIKEIREIPQSENLKELLNLLLSFQVFNEQIKAQTNKKEQFREDLDRKFESIQKKVNEINDIYFNMENKYKNNIENVYSNINSFDKENNHIDNILQSIQREIKEAYIDEEPQDENIVNNTTVLCSSIKKSKYCTMQKECVWCLNNNQCIEGNINGPLNTIKNRKCIKNYLYGIEPIN